MATKKVVDLVFECAQPIVSKMGFVLVDVEYVKKQNGMNLGIFIDKPNGIVNLDDCEKVSKALDEPLDVLDPTNGASYYFNVSSLGLDRPITTEYQFNKFLGSEVEVKFYKPFMPYNTKNLVGQLAGFSESEIAIIINEEKINITKTEIAQIVPVVKF